IQNKGERRQGPDRHQDDLAPEVVPDLDLFLVFMRRFVRLVVALRFEEEVSDLPADHRSQPSYESRGDRVGKQHCVRAQKADGAQQVKRLVDPAMVVITVIVPALQAQGLQKAVHGSLLSWQFEERLMTASAD